jgi:FkbM family methyltransferase
MTAVEPVSELQAEEGELYRLLADAVATRTLVDVGAHHGTALRPFLHAGWHVHAFEPIEANRRKLAENFPSHPRLNVRPEVVTDSDGTATLHLALHPDGSPHEFYHSLERIGDDPWHRKGQDLVVPAVTLDRLARHGDIPARVGFLKIDTEGHDLAVLRGAGHLDCEVIGVEFWCDGHALGRSPSPPGEMVRLLAGRGYPHYLTVRHRGDATAVLRSTLDGIGGGDWGNILFFRADRGDLYRRVAGQIARGDRGTAAHPPTGRVWDLLRSVFAHRDDLTFVDVGAYQGDFAGAMLAVFPASHGLLFEADVDAHAALIERFSGNPAIATLPTALCASAFRASSGTPAGPVSGKTLDGVLAEKIGTSKGPDFIRIDARGHGLDVVRAARETLRERRPAVLVKVVFADARPGQESHCDLFHHMNEAGYRLSALLHAHAHRSGADAFADALFLPPELHARLVTDEPDYVCLDADDLRRQNAMLQKACDERLELINRLNEVAEERLRLARENASRPKRRSLKRWLSWAR